MTEILIRNSDSTIQFVKHVNQYSLLSLSLQSTSSKSASSMKWNCHACEIILRITRDLIYHFNHCLTLRNDVQFFKKYLRKENSTVNEYTDTCKYFQTDLWYEMIMMNDIDVSDFEQSTEENVEASDDQKHFRNSIAWISLDFKRFINSSCTFSFIKVDNYDEMNDIKKRSVDESLKQYIRLIRIILNYSKFKQDSWSSLDDNLQSEWLFFSNEKDFSFAQWFNWQRDSSVHDVDYESFDFILCLNRSQKSQEISIQRSSNDVRTLRNQKSHCAEFSLTRQHLF